MQPALKRTDQLAQTMPASLVSVDLLPHDTTLLKQLREPRHGMSSVPAGFGPGYWEINTVATGGDLISFFFISYVGSIIISQALS